MKYFFFAFLFSATTWASSTYKLIWNNQPPIDFKYRVFEIPSAYSEKVGTSGSILSSDQLTPIQEFKNGEIVLKNEKSIILALVVQSPSEKAFDFFVSPHHTHPEIAGLDFKFNCLCYHHVYHLEKGKLWYRIMKLSKTSDNQNGEQLIKLEHDVIARNH